MTNSIMNLNLKSKHGRCSFVPSSCLLYYCFLILSSLLSSSSSLALALDYRFFVAGGGAAALSHGITTPVDVVKTKMQANPEQFEGKNLVQASLEIIKTDPEGPRALLAGLVPTIVGYGLEGAAKFGLYEICKPLVSSLFAATGDSSSTSALGFLIASIVAGSVAALMLCPAESARIKMVTDPSYASTGLFGALSRIVKTEGIGPMFGGFPAMLSKQVPYTAAKQVSFDIFASLLYTALSKIPQQQQALLVPVIAAAGASILASLSSQPGDMILTETYRNTGGGDSENGGDFGSVVQRLWQRGGIGQFFVGTNARLVHVGAIITSQLVVYDMLKQLLGLPATGSH